MTFTSSPMSLLKVIFLPSRRFLRNVHSTEGREGRREDTNTHRRVRITITMFDCGMLTHALVGKLGLH